MPARQWHEPRQLSYTATTRSTGVVVGVCALVVTVLVVVTVGGVDAYLRFLDLAFLEDLEEGKARRSLVEQQHAVGSFVRTPSGTATPPPAAAAAAAAATAAAAAVHSATHDGLWRCRQPRGAFL